MAPRITETDARALGIEGFEPKSKRRHKYNVAKREDRTWRGRCYDSKAEMLYAQMLDLDPNVREVVEQPKVKLGCPENVYRPDFLVITMCDVYYVDVKGIETTAFKRNKKLWAKYGRLPLLIVKLQRFGGCSSFIDQTWIHPATKKGDS